MANTPLDYKNDTNEDDRLNPAELARQEQTAGEAEANNPTNSSQENLQEQEESSNTFNYTTGGTSTRSATSLKGILKRAGPTGGIIGVIIGAVFGGSLFFSPSLLLVQVKEVFTNYNSSGSRAAPSRYNMLLQNVIGGDADKQCKNKPSGIRCRIGTMSDKQKKAYEKEGFKFDTKEVNGRHIIKKVTFPDEKTTATSGKEFNKILSNNSSFRAKALRAFNPKTAIFNGGNRFSIKVLKPLGLSKAKFKLDGQDESERAKDFDKKTSLDIPDESEIDSKARVKLTKAGTAVKAKNVAGAACTTYGIARAALGAAKLEAALRLARFAMPFLKVGDEIKASGNGGNPDIDTISHLGTVLTKTDSTGDKAGLSATDSQGFKVAAYGGEGELKDFTKAYLLGGSATLLTLETLVDKSAKVLGGRDKARKVCRGINSYTATAAQCAVFAPTIVGGIICLGGQLIVGAAVGILAGKLIGLAMPYVVKAVLGTDISSKLYGVDAGNALAGGIGFILLKSNLSKGMKPSKKGDVSAFLAATAGTEREYELAMREDAKATPFDVYNQYSFLGSFVRNSGVTYSPGLSFAQLLKNTSTLAFSGMNIVPKTFAAASMPLELTEEDLSHCEEVDKDLADIGVDCDLMGGVQGSMSTEELEMPVEDNLDYMIDNKYIDEETGKAIPDTFYDKWVKYCTDNRQDILGSASSSPEEDDYDWQIGANCVEPHEEDLTEEDLSNFRVYYNITSMKEESDGVEEETDSANGKFGTVCTINDKSLNESSGMAASVKHKNIVYTHNDEGNTIYAIDTNTCAVVGKFNVKGVRSDPDPEAIQVDHSTGKIWFGDIGNGHPTQPSSMTDKDPTLKYPKLPARIIVFDEPDQFSGTITNVQTYDVTYEGGMQNSEALLANPKTGEGYIISKYQNSKIFTLPKSIGGEAKDTGKRIPEWVTDATFTNDGKWVLVRYRTVNDPAPTNVFVYDPTTWEHVGDIPVPKVEQGESITAAQDGVSFYIGSESKSGQTPLVRVALPSQYASASNTGDGSNSGPGEVIPNLPSREGWVWPVPGVNSMGTCGYGERCSKGIHKGIDIGAFGGSTLGKNVVAAHEGTVNWVSTVQNSSCGSYISITAKGTGYYAAYQHVEKSSIKVKAGDPVKAGQVIAQVGKQGGSTCGSSGFYHLHFSIESKPGIVSQYSDPFPNGTVDPLKVLPR